MLMLTPSISMLVQLCLGLLSVALIIVLTSSSRRTFTFKWRAALQPFYSATRLGTRLHDAAATLVAATVPEKSNATFVRVEVLLENRAQRARTHRHVRAALARCIATMGTPPANCAVLIAHRLERDGRPLSGCVERLNCTDGTMRTLISLSIANDPGAPSSDAIAARLAGYYLIATGAERTVLGTDPPSPLPRSAIVATTRATPPGSIGRITLPVIVDGKRA